MKGWQNQYDYGFRIYDPRIGRFLSVDPLTQNYPWYTPYQFAGNMPISFVDLDGLEPIQPPSSSAAIQTGDGRYIPDYRRKDVQNAHWGAMGVWMVLAATTATSFYGGFVAGTVFRIVVTPAVITSATAAAPVIAKYGPDAVNFAYGLTTGDDMEPIPTNTGSQSADVGVLLRGLFKAPVEIGGFLKKAGVETATFVKGATGSKVAVIGQGMEKVKQVASGLQNAEVFTPSTAARRQWDKLLADNRGKQLADDVVKKTRIFRENEAWIKKVKKEGYDILDTGGGNTSTFYNMEKEAVYGGKKE